MVLPVLSFVIPTFQAAALLGPTLEAVGKADFPHEVVVCDGGSEDATCEVAMGLGARVAVCPRGRGIQLAAGAAVAQGAWLLFLHADTVPEPGWATAAAAFMEAPENRHRVAYFRFALDGRERGARRLERMVDWRCRTLGLPYGDQGLLIARPFYDETGGFRPLPLMEDVDMVRRIGRHRLACLDVAAVTSAGRYRKGGYLRRPLRNLTCLGLYFLGVPPRLIAKVYS